MRPVSKQGVVFTADAIGMPNPTSIIQQVQTSPWVSVARELIPVAKPLIEQLATSLSIRNANELKRMQAGNEPQYISGALINNPEMNGVM